MPRRFLTISFAFSSSTTGGGWLMSYPQTISHSFHGRIMRTRPAPMPPTLEPGWMTQYRTLGLVLTWADISALKVMFIDPAMSILPS